MLNRATAGLGLRAGPRHCQPGASAPPRPRRRTPSWLVRARRSATLPRGRAKQSWCSHGRRFGDRERPSCGRLAGRWRAHGAAARGRAGRAVRAAARLRSAAASGRRVRPDAAPGCHGPALPLARGRGRDGERGGVRRDGDRHLPAQSGAGGVRHRRADPPPDRGARTARTTTRSSRRCAPRA